MIITFKFLILLFILTDRLFYGKFRTYFTKRGIVMDVAAALLMLGGMVLFLVGVVWLIVSALKRKEKKSALISLLLSVIVFVVGIVLMPVDTPAAPNSANNAARYSDTEIFAAEFCMAYMNSLKNPYSFKVKSIWANDAGDGKYEVYVKFTAENSLGGEVADEVATMSSLDHSDLKELAQGGEYVAIHTWNSEPTGKIIGDGEDLDASKIQEYINANYK